MRLGDLPAYRRYQLAYARGDLAAARLSLDRALADERAREDIHVRSFLLRCLASVQAQSGERELARSTLEEATTVSAPSPEAAMMTATAWLDALDDAHAALNIASDLLQQVTSHEAQKNLAAQLLALKGRCLAELGDSEAARSCLVDLRTLVQPHVIEHALELCEHLLAHDSSRALARSHLADMLSALERSPEESYELRRHVKALLEQT